MDRPQRLTTSVVHGVPNASLDRSAAVRSVFLTERRVMGSRKRIAGLAVVGAIAFVAAALPSAATAAFPGENGRIAYTRSAGLDDSGIFSILSDGSQGRRLTTRGVEPAWSADGRRIAFTFDSNVFTMNADGGDTTRLANTGNPQAAAAFSPNGKRIAFPGAPPGAERAGIWTIRTDGSGLRRLVRGEELFDPEYAPNGKRIVFAAPFRGKRGIWTMRRNGSRLRRLTNEKSDFAPDYSPDGRNIVFTRGADFLSTPIRVMRADGSHEHGIPTPDTGIRLHSRVRPGRRSDRGRDWR
jgi:Tol biopolymer transport system component